VQLGEFNENIIPDPKDKDKKKKITARNFDAKYKSRMTPEIFYAYITKN